VAQVKDEQISLSPHLISLKQAQERAKGSDGSPTKPAGPTENTSTPPPLLATPGTSATTETKNPRKHLRMRGRTASSSAALSGSPPVRRKSSKNLAKKENTTSGTDVVWGVFCFGLSN